MRFIQTKAFCGSKLVYLLMSILLVALSVSCNSNSSEELVVYSSRTSSLVQPLLERYATESGHNVQVRYATTASIIATLLEEGNNAQADDVYLAEPRGWGLLSEAGMLAQLPVPTAISQLVTSHWQGVRLPVVPGAFGRRPDQSCSV